MGLRSREGVVLCLVNIYWYYLKLLLSVAYLYNAMERGVCGNVVQFGIVGVRYDLPYKIPFSLSSDSERPEILMICS